jgi:hypothetical protein
MDHLSVVLATSVRDPNGAVSSLPICLGVTILLLPWANLPIVRGLIE